MKIIQIMPEFGLAGAEIMCENLTYELQKHGHTVIVVSMYDYRSPITDRMERSGIDIRYLGKKAGLDLSMIRKMRRIFKQEKPDAIHTHRYVMQYAIPAAVIAGVKRRVHTFHSVAQKENNKPARIANKFFFKHFHVTPVALSELVRDTIVKEYKIAKDKIPVIFNGIDLSKCAPKTDYSINENFKILHIGRFAEPKNHKGLLLAFQKFHNKYPNSELQLIGDGEKREEIKLFVEENAMNGCVNFLGLQDDVYVFLNEADIFTLPSVYEGIPMTLIEAMGTGLPIVASCVGGIPDMIVDGVSGLLCEPNADSIMKKIEMFLSDEQLRKNCGCNALKASKKFSAATMYEGYKVLYANKTDK